MSQQWKLEIDWDADGSYDATNYADRISDCYISRGRKFILDADGTGFEPMEVGILSLLLDNDDLIFDPYNTGSSLYPNVRPGVKIKLSTKQSTDLTYTPIFTGTIWDIDPISGKPNTVRVISYDGIKILEEADLQMAIQQNIDVDDAIALVLTTIGWPWSSSLDDSPDVIRYFFVDQEVKAARVIKKMIDSSLGKFFTAADGTAKFYERNRIGSSVLTLQSNNILKEISVRQPWEVVKNSISVVGYPRAEQTETELWRLFDKPQIGAGETITIWGRFTYQQERVPVLNYTAPVAITDFTANTSSDGSGTDLTGSVSVAVDMFPTSVKFTVTNTSGSNGYITLLKIRGNPLTTTSLQSVEEDSASIAAYGKKALEIDTEFLQDTNMIMAISKLLIILFNEPRKYPVIQVQNRPDFQFSLDLFDVISLEVPARWIDDDFYVAHIDHSWMSRNGQETMTVYYLEPINVLATEVWRFTTEIGVSSKFAF